MKTRRDFLAKTSVGIVGAALVNSHTPEPVQEPSQTPAGMPPAFGTAKPAGPEVSLETFQEGEKLVQFELNARDRAQAAGTWRVNMAPLYESRVGPRKVVLP